MRHYVFVIIWTLLLWNPIILMRQGTGKWYNLTLMLIILVISLLSVYFSSEKWRNIVCALLVIVTMVFYVRLIYQSGFTDKHMPQWMAERYNKKLPKDCHLEMITVNGKQTEMISVSQRKIVLINYKGLIIPFYLSTGKGKKIMVPAGRWYPFFGLDKEGWFNKASQQVIREYYYNDLLKEIAFSLDDAIGDIRGSARGVSIPGKKSPEYAQIRTQVNRDVRGDKPYLDSNGDNLDISEIKAGDSKQFYDRIKRVLSRIDSLRQK